MNNSIELTEKLKNLRKRTGLARQDFAEKFGIHYNTYIQWESGRRTPQMHVLTMIEKIMAYEQIMSDRIKLQKRIETIEYFIKVLEKAGMYCPNDADVASYEACGNLVIIKKDDVTYYLFKDDRGYQAAYMPAYEKYLEKEEIEAKFYNQS